MSLLFSTTLRAIPDASRPQEEDDCLRPWSSPTELRTADGRWLNVNAPQIVHSSQGTVLVSNRARLSVRDGDSLRVVDGTAIGAILHPDRTVAPIPSPAPGRRMLWPRAAGDDAGGVHFVWGETDDSVSPSPRATRLLYSRLSEGAWSTPEIVVESPALGWRGLDHSSLVSASGRLFLAVPQSRPFVNSNIFVLRRSEERWESLRMPVPISAAYAQLAVLPGGRLALAWVAPARGVGRDRNSVFVAHSIDSGETWSVATQVHRGGVNAAFDPRLTVGQGSRLVLMWAQDDEDHPGNDSLVAVVSEDGGATWGPPTSTLVTGGVNGNLAAAGGDESDVVVASGPELTLRHFLWRGDRWRECGLPRGDGRFGYSVATDGRHHLLVWSGRPDGVSGGRALATFVSQY